MAVSDNWYIKLVLCKLSKVSPLPIPFLLSISTCFLCTMYLFCNFFPDCARPSPSLSLHVLCQNTRRTSFICLNIYLPLFRHHFGVVASPNTSYFPFCLFTSIHPLFRVHFGVLASPNTWCLPFRLFTSIHPLFRVHFGVLASLDTRCTPSPLCRVLSVYFRRFFLCRLSTALIPRFFTTRSSIHYVSY
jgi:hypothetical protein